MSRVRGTVSKALLMTIVTNRVRCAGLGVFKPSCMCWVSVVRSFVVEWWALKSCCVRERGMCGVTFVRTSLSSILRGLHSREMDL